jgi:hypothetical protein
MCSIPERKKYRGNSSEAYTGTHFHNGPSVNNGAKPNEYRPLLLFSLGLTPILDDAKYKE